MVLAAEAVPEVPAAHVPVGASEAAAVVAAVAVGVVAGR